MVFNRDGGSWSLTVAVLTAGSIATHPSMGEAEDVEAIFKKGTELRREGRDAEALVEFQRAARIQDSPRAIAQVALAEQAVGLWVDAHTHLVRALEHGDDPWIKKHRVALDGALNTIRARLCHVEVWGAPAGAQILIEGKHVGALPTISTWVVAGEGSFEVKAHGYVEVLRAMKFPEAGHIREHVDLRLLASPVPKQNTGPSPAEIGPSSLIAKPSEPVPATEGADAPIYRQWWFWTLIGAGVVAAGGTTVWLVTRNGNGTDACTAPCSTW